MPSRCRPVRPMRCTQDGQEDEILVPCRRHPALAAPPVCPVRWRVMEHEVGGRAVAPASWQGAEGLGTGSGRMLDVSASASLCAARRQPHSASTHLDRACGRCRGVEADDQVHCGDVQALLSDAGGHLQRGGCTDLRSADAGGPCKEMAVQHMCRLAVKGAVASCIMHTAPHGAGPVIHEFTAARAMRPAAAGAGARARPPAR